MKYIPNKQSSNNSSHFGKDIQFIIDNTIHRTTKPIMNQKDDYNGHYIMHERQTQLLIDFQGYVISFLTNIKGKYHDSLSSIYNKTFMKNVGDKYILGDPGFNGCSGI